MSNIIKSIEIYNVNYRLNGLPEYLIFNLEEKGTSFRQSIEDILNLKFTKEEKQAMCYKNLIQAFTNADCYMDLTICNVYLVDEYKSTSLTHDLSEGIIIEDTLVLIDIKDDYLYHIYLNVDINNKTEKYCLGDIVLLDKLNNKSKQTEDNLVHYFGELENIEEVCVMQHQSKEGYLRISIKFKY